MLRARVPLLAAVAALCVLASFVEAGRGSGGTYSLPIGNPVISGTTITSTWANTTLQDLGTEITNSLDRNGRGAMTAPLKLTTGTAGAPSLTFSSDVTSGIFLNGVGDVRVAASTSNAQRWTSTLSTLFTPLTVTGLTTTTTLRVTDSSDQLTVVPTNADVDAIIATARGAGNAGSFTSTGVGRGISSVSESGIAVYAESTSGTGLWAWGVSYGAQLRAGGADGVGALALGGSAGYGVKGEGGLAGVSGTSTAGVGVGGTSTSNTGVVGVGIVGVLGTGSASGVRGANQTAATAASRTVAVHASNGDLSFSGTVSPNSNVGLANTLTPTNIIKAWGTISISGTTATVNGGFCVASASAESGYTVVVTLASGCQFSGTSYAIVLGDGPGFSKCHAVVTGKTASSFTVWLPYLNGYTEISSGTPFNDCRNNPPDGYRTWDGVSFDFIATGAQ